MSVEKIRLERADFPEQAGILSCGYARAFMAGIYLNSDLKKHA